MKNRFAIIFSVLVGLAMCVSPSDADARKKNNNELTVISYNVRLVTTDDGENQWKYRAPATPAMIKDYSPDIFGVQEAVLEQLEYMDKYLPNYSYVGVGRENGKQRGETMAIFYNTKRVKLLDWGTYWLSETPDVPSRGWDAGCRRTVTWTLLEMKDSGKRFFYVNTHLDHVGVQARQKGLDLIVSKIAAMNPDNLPMVLTGDFNVQPNNPALTELNTKMKDARKTAAKTDNRATYNGWGRFASVIDYIYYDGFTSCPEYETIVRQYKNIPYISDHYPIVARLVF
jgi:endonuclease/exonuclease/phosphatase family metal-dependent hydrolase